jgi:hypothetical protein
MAAMHWAASNGHEATVQLLIDRGANIEAHDLICCWKPYRARS